MLRTLYCKSGFLWIIAKDAIFKRQSTLVNYQRMEENVPAIGNGNNESGAFTSKSLNEHRADALATDESSFRLVSSKSPENIFNVGHVGNRNHTDVRERHPLEDVKASSQERKKPLLLAKAKSYTLTPFVNDSSLLQALVHLGVDLAEVERKSNAADLIVKLDLERHVKPLVDFLTSRAAVPLERIGKLLTSNPWLFQQNLQDLEVRVNYLESKKFSSDSIARIVTKAVFWLNFDVKQIDRRLGWIQKEYSLSGDEMRFVITKAPKLVTFGTGYLQMQQFTLHEQLGFNVDEMKQLILKDPAIYQHDRRQLAKTFDYLHNKIGFAHERLVKWPRILRYPQHHVRARHEFLKELSRDQYDCERPNYVSLEALVSGNDMEFCKNIAKSAVSVYNRFLRKIL